MNHAASIRLTIEEHVFRVTPEEANLIGEALGKLPYDNVVALITKLQAQANKQIEAAARARIENGASGVMTSRGADVGLPQQRFTAEDLSCVSPPSITGRGKGESNGSDIAAV